MTPTETRRRELPWWLFAAILMAIAFGLVIGSSESYRIIFRAVASGIWVTVFVTVFAYAFACVIGLGIASAGLSKHRLLREAATFYVEIIRGVPVLVLLFYMAFVAAPALVALAASAPAGLIEAVAGLAAEARSSVRKARACAIHCKRCWSTCVGPTARRKAAERPVRAAAGLAFAGVGAA